MKIVWKHVKGVCESVWKYHHWISKLEYMYSNLEQLLYDYEMKEMKIRKERGMSPLRPFFQSNPFPLKPISKVSTVNELY